MSYKGRKLIKMKKIKVALAGLFAVSAMIAGSAIALSGDVYAQAQSNIEKGVTAAGGGSTTSVNVVDTVGGVVGWLLFAVGAISVIMLIWGGIKYATSSGDSNKVTAAKNTVLYSIIGLAIAVLSYAIVQLVIDNLSGGSVSGP